MKKSPRTAPAKSATRAKTTSVKKKKAAANQPPGKRILAEGKYLRLVADGHWEFAERKTVTGVVTIVAVTEAGGLLLIEQFRPPLGKRVIELPAGLAGDTPGAELEELAAAAERELLEETGYEAGEMTYLTAGPTSAGMTTEVVTFFRATRLKQVTAGGGDASEDIEVHEIPLATAADWLAARSRAGLDIDPKIYAGLYFAGCVRAPYSSV